MSSSDEIFNAVQTLAPSERWELVSRLWAALPAEAWDGPSKEELAEWDQRLADIDSGRVEAISRDEIRRRIEKIV